MNQLTECVMIMMTSIKFVGVVLSSAVMAVATGGCGAEMNDGSESSTDHEDSAVQDDSRLDEENARAASQALSAAGDTANICSSTWTPSGWVDVGWWNSFSCGSTFVPNVKQIKQLTGYAVGTKVNACSSSYPPNGWSITGSYYSSVCAYSSSFNNNSWTLVRSY